MHISFNRIHTINSTSININISWGMVLEISNVQNYTPKYTESYTRIHRIYE